MRIKSKAVVRGGVKYDSKLEAEYAGILDGYKRNGLIREYRRPAPTLPILGGQSRYTADFFVVANDGTIELHEVKGFWTDAGLLRFKAAASEWGQFVFKAIEKKRGVFTVTREL